MTVTPTNLVDELLTCLDVLWDKLVEETTPAWDKTWKAVPREEWLAAIPQVIELVYAMAQELERAHGLIEDYVAAGPPPAPPGLVGPDGRSGMGV